MSPQLRHIDDYEKCANRLRSLPGVEAVDVNEDDPRVDGPLAECTIGPGFDRVPPRVLRTIADCDLGIDDVSTQGVEPTRYHVAVIR